MYVAVLADAVNTTKALFKARWVPGEVVVNHQPTELEVDTFTCSFGRDADLARRTEVLLHSLPFVRIHSTVNLAGRVSPTVQVVE